MQTFSLIHRLLLSLFIALTSIFAFTINANADEASAEAEVESNCIFFGAEPGELAVNDNGTILSSSTGGKSATVEIDCSGAATVTISKPSPNSSTGSTTFSAENLSATATSSILSKSINSGESATIEAESTGTIKVDMQASTGSSTKITPGTYSFTVTITATP